jgi:diguanylate cyclase (GGDEF)-like protein
MSRLFVVRTGGPDSAARAADTLVTAVSHLVHTAADADFTIADLLGDLFVLATRTLGVDGATVALADGTRLTFGQVDTSTEPGSPSGPQAITALPLLASGRVWGVVDFYRPVERGWPVGDVALARSFSQVAASSIAVAAARERAKADASERDRRRADAEWAGIPHRAFLLDRVDHALSTSARRGCVVGVLVVDIDGFRLINARIGAQRGDLLLADLAHQIRLTLATSHTLSRMSGDAYAVICGDLTGSPSQVDQGLRRIGRGIQRGLRCVTTGETGTTISASIGAAVATRRCDAAELLGDACAAMIAAKGRGGGQVVVSEPAVVALADRRMTRERSGGG